MKNIQDLILLSQDNPKIKKIKVKKGEIISNFIPNRNQFGIILEGCADLIRYDIDGNRSIVERFYKGGMFAESLYSKIIVNELFVEAKTTVSLLLFNYEDVIEDNGEFKTIVFDLLIKKVAEQNTRISILTQRMLRDKILAYFNHMSNNGIRKKFRLHFSITDFADYLNVDRSSLSREMTNLMDEGFIDKNGREITLLY